ncbi:MAG: hypothetical protein HKO98_14145 [Gemmatimonadetes bacterium]|nr:hypothetical protein [Gemmatimonadota bacterium]
MANGSTFRVIDAYDGPHAGRILRLRLESGDAPTVRSLKGARLRALSPDGDERFVRVDGFPLFGGKVSDARLEKTGRIDVHVTHEGDGVPVAARWAVSAA